LGYSFDLAERQFVTASAAAHSWLPDRPQFAVVFEVMQEKVGQLLLKGAHRVLGARALQDAFAKTMDCRVKARQ
jgi:hypothetical protein